jgi:hypothetical protein
MTILAEDGGVSRSVVSVLEDVREDSVTVEELVAGLSGWASFADFSLLCWR